MGERELDLPNGRWIRRDAFIEEMLDEYPDEDVDAERLDDIFDSMAFDEGVLNTMERNGEEYIQFNGGTTRMLSYVAQKDASQLPAAVRDSFVR